MLRLLLSIAYFLDSIAKEITREMQSGMTVDANMWADIRLKTLELRDTILSYLVPSYFTNESIIEGDNIYELPFLHYVGDSFDLKVLCEGEPPLWLPDKEASASNQTQATKTVLWSGRKLMNHLDNLDYANVQKYGLDNAILRCASAYDTLAKEAEKNMAECASGEDDDGEYGWKRKRSDYRDKRDDLLSMLEPSYFTVDEIDCGTITFDIPFYHYESEGIHLAVPAVGRLDFQVPQKESNGLLGLLPTSGEKNQTLPESLCNTLYDIFIKLKEWRHYEDT